MLSAFRKNETRLDFQALIFLILWRLTLIKRKIWKINNTKQDLNELITQLNISPLVAKVLMERGYTNYEIGRAHV